MAITYDISYQELKKTVMSLGFKNANEYRSSAKNGDIGEVPIWPDRTYSEFEGWPVFLGRKVHDTVSYEEAHKLALKNGIRTAIEWKTAKVNGDLPHNVPENPKTFYGDKWTGWKNFLGKADDLDKILPFAEAKKAATVLAKKHGVTAYRLWWKAVRAGKIPDNLPNNPSRFYEKEWAGWPDFLGTKNEALHTKKFVELEKASEFAKSLGLRSSAEWREWVAENGDTLLPAGIPKAPAVVYKQSFKDNGGWKTFLGNEYMDFFTAKAYIQKLNIKSWTEFRVWASSNERPVNFPSQPHSHPAYLPYWVNYPEFLGYGASDGVATGRKATEELALNRARELIKQFPSIIDTLKSELGVS